MAFSIRCVVNCNVFSGVAASLNNLSEAGKVVSSFVRRLKIQYINTKKGLFHRLPTSVTEGSGRSFSSSRNILTTCSILELLTGINFLWDPYIRDLNLPCIFRPLTFEKSLFRASKRHGHGGLNTGTENLTSRTVQARRNINANDIPGL